MKVFSIKRFIFIAGFILVLIPLNLLGQNHTISGYVQDSLSGENLLGANIYDANTGIGTSANEYGFFSLSLPSGQIKLQVSYVGYASWYRSFLLNSDNTFNILLDPSVELEEVMVTTHRPQDIVEDVQMSTEFIKEGDIQQVRK